MDSTQPPKDDTEQSYYEDLRIRLLYQIEDLKWEISGKQEMHARMAGMFQVLQPIVLIGGAIVSGLLAKRHSLGLVIASSSFTAASPLLFSPVVNSRMSYEYEKLRDTVDKIDLEFDVPATPLLTKDTEELLCRAIYINKRYGDIEPYIFPWMAKSVLKDMKARRDLHGKTGYSWAVVHTLRTPEELDKLSESIGRDRDSSA